MDIAQFLQDSRVTDAIAALKDSIRREPARVDPRVLLFALNCLSGRLDKAVVDLEAIKSLDAGWVPAAAVYQNLVDAEIQRRGVFAGKLKPLVMGEPEPWIGWNVQSLALEADGSAAEALDLRHRAWEAASEQPCLVDGAGQPWLCDTDRRLGPVLEAVLDGKYYWIPFGRLARVEIRPIEFLVELVWVPATITVVTGGELHAHLPVRYPGTETQSDERLWLARTTEWGDTAAGTVPFGQKLWETESTDFGLLTCRTIQFQR